MNNKIGNSNKDKESKLKFYLDDKGRKVYYFNDENKKNDTNNTDGDFNKENKNVLELELTENIDDKNNKLISEYINTDILNDFQNKRDINLKKGVFFCDICNLDSKDSRSYIEHLNGKVHNSKLGMNMKVLKLGVEPVIEKLKLLSRKTDLSIIKDKLKYLQYK